MALFLTERIVHRKGEHQVLSRIAFEHKVLIEVLVYMCIQITIAFLLHFCLVTRKDRQENGNRYQNTYYFLHI